MASECTCTHQCSWRKDIRLNFIIFFVHDAWFRSAGLGPAWLLLAALGCTWLFLAVLGCSWLTQHRYVHAGVRTYVFGTNIFLRRYMYKISVQFIIISTFIMQ